MIYLANKQGEITMIQFKKLILLSSAFVLLGLGGCSTVVSSSNYALSKAIVKDSDRLNDAYNKATNGVIVKNVLRARDRVPTNFTTLSGIQSVPQITSGSSLLLGPLGFGNPTDPSPFQGSTETFTNQVRSQNTYNINPFAGGGGRTESLLFDVSEEQFQRYWNGWPKDVVFLMFVDSVSVDTSQFEKNDNAKVKEARTSLEKKTCSNSGDNYDEFTKCMNELVSRRKVLASLEKDPKFDGIPNLNDKTVFAYKNLKFVLPKKKRLSNTKPSADKNGTRICKTVQVGLKDLIKADGQVENLEELHDLTNVNIAFSVPKKNNNADNIDLEICAATDQTGHIFQYKGDGDTELELSVTYRSFDDIIYYLGETMRFDDKFNAMRPVVQDACRPGVENEPMVPLMRVHGEFRPGNNYLQFPNSQYAVSINHAGENYNALPILGAEELKNWKTNGHSTNEKCMGERTSTVMSILNQLLLLNQSETFLQAPENTIIQ